MNASEEGFLRTAKYKPWMLVRLLSAGADVRIWGMLMSAMEELTEGNVDCLLELEPRPDWFSATGLSCPRP